MSFLEGRLDAKITRGATGGPIQPGRRKIYDASGRLTQVFTNGLALHRYDVSHGVRSAADYQTVLDLFYVVMYTPYEGFRFKDWRDFRLTQTNSRLVLVSGTNYQIHRVHTFGGQEFLRPIYKPVAAVTAYNAGGVELASTTDTTTGIVTVPSGTPLTCVGEFDVPVTFVNDEWIGSLEVHTQNLHIESDSIQLEEIRL
jgi:uncharacterized protein (TIGR02217 family)